MTFCLSKIVKRNVFLSFFTTIWKEADKKVTKCKIVHCFIRYFGKASKKFQGQILLHRLTWMLVNWVNSDNFKPSRKIRKITIKQYDFPIQSDILVLYPQNQFQHVKAFVFFYFSKTTSPKKYILEILLCSVIFFYVNLFFGS